MLTALFLIGLLCAGWPLAYGCSDDDTHRANWAIVFQTALDGLLVFLMLEVVHRKFCESQIDNKIAGLWGFNWRNKFYGDILETVPGTVFGIADVALAVGVGILPQVLIATNEGFSPDTNPRMSAR